MTDSTPQDATKYTHIEAISTNLSSKFQSMFTKHPHVITRILSLLLITYNKFWKIKNALWSWNRRRRSNRIWSESPLFSDDTLKITPPDIWWLFFVILHRVRTCHLPFRSSHGEPSNRRLYLLRRPAKSLADWFRESICSTKRKGTHK